MNSYEVGRTFLGRLLKGGDLLKELTKIAEENDISTGVIQVIGAVECAKIGYYEQSKEEYVYQDFDQHLEIVNCIGNISIMDGKPMVHAHISLADEKGNSYGGHLAEGTIIFASEAYIQELKGEKLVRTYDESTGLSLW